MAQQRFAKKTPKRDPKTVFHDIKSTHTNVAGTVKWFNPTRGFGFVICDGVDVDIFLHAKILERKGIDPKTIEEDRPVHISFGQGPKGLCATDITV